MELQRIRELEAQVAEAQAALKATEGKVGLLHTHVYMYMYAHTHSLSLSRTNIQSTHTLSYAPSLSHMCPLWSGRGGVEVCSLSHIYTYTHAHARTIPISHITHTQVDALVSPQLMKGAQGKVQLLEAEVSRVKGEAASLQVGVCICRVG